MLHASLIDLPAGRTLFGQTAPASAATAGAPFTAVAPESPLLDGGMTIAPVPTVSARREAVGAIVRLPGQSVSAGDETTPVPQVFDLPRPLRDVFRGLRGGIRRTLLAPELQSELDATNANVMPGRGMAQPYTVREPGPWYEEFSRQFGAG